MWGITRRGWVKILTHLDTPRCTLRDKAIMGALYMWEIVPIEFASQSLCPGMNGGDGLHLWKFSKQLNERGGEGASIIVL